MPVSTPQPGLAQSARVVRWGERCRHGLQRVCRRCSCSGSSRFFLILARDFCFFQGDNSADPAAVRGAILAFALVIDYNGLY